jgi:hypothetical protein
VVGERRLHAAPSCPAGVSQRPLSACSACPGDYEDPDRTAWTLEPEENDEDPADPAEEELAETHDSAGRDEEFPAKEA